MKKQLVVVCLMIALVAGALGGARAADLRQAGREWAKQYGDAVILVSVVASIKVSYGGQDSPEQESKSQVCGTVLSPDGLTLVALSSIDPSTHLKDLYGDRMEGLQMDCRVKDIRLVLDKKTELEATVVLRDPDLGIAFIRPKTKPEKELSFISLKNSAKAQLLEQVFVLGRMGKVANNELGAMTGEIQAVVKKPRLFYVPSGELVTGGVGAPIFNIDGKVVGIVLFKTVPGGGEMSMGGVDEGALGIILPADQIAEIAKQAKDDEDEE